MSTNTHVIPVSPKLSDVFKTVLDILVITILSDERTRDRERIEFIHFAQVHNGTLHPDIILTPAQLRRLFQDRSDFLRNTISQDGLKTVQETYLAQIIDRGLQRRVLASIFAIAICDYELHDEECGMIQTALNVWDSHLPDPTEIISVS